MTAAIFRGGRSILFSLLEKTEKKKKKFFVVPFAEIQRLVGERTVEPGCRGVALRCRINGPSLLMLHCRSLTSACPPLMLGGLNRDVIPSCAEIPRCQLRKHLVVLEIAYTARLVYAYVSTSVLYSLRLTCGQAPRNV